MQREALEHLRSAGGRRGRGTAAVTSVQEAHRRFLAEPWFPALDGLRALSILPVVWHHATPGPLPGIVGKGAVGVDLFFAISGFLITTLLLRERRATGTIGLGAFYARRGLRIFPLYSAVLRPDHGLRRLTAAPFLVRIGAVSYGIYLFHVPVIGLFRRLAPPLQSSAPALFAVAFLVTWGLALLSHRHFERRFLDLRQRFRRGQTAEGKRLEGRSACGRVPS